MNYRHAYHAGNFADVVKHAVLVRIVEYLKAKEAAFRVVDTHAGAGLYHLGSGAASRTGEWQTGIGKLLDAKLPSEAARLLEPYLAAVRAVNPAGQLTTYPGSPVIVRSLLRKQDRLTAIELHPDDARTLEKRFAGDIQARIIELDGWLSLGAHVPPKEKRGLALVDPPFELAGEYERLIEGLAKAYKRWPGGVYVLWYPVKDRAAVRRFRQALSDTGIPKILDVRFDIRAAAAEARLDGSGLIVVNPPFVLEAELKTMLPALSKVLAEDGASRFTVEWLSGEELPRSI